MSRTTQYIGLTANAVDYVNRRSTGKRPIVLTTGMFEENVTGYEYDLPTPAGPNKRLIAREIVQACPWSAGPMIFTCLGLILTKNDGSKINQGKIFQWVQNPELRSEYNPFLGQYWV